MTKRKKLLIIFSLCASAVIGIFIAVSVCFLNYSVGKFLVWGKQTVSEFGAHFESEGSVMSDIRTIYPDVKLIRHDEYYKHTPDTPNQSYDQPDNIEHMYYLSNCDIDFTLRIYISVWIGWSRMYECDYDKKLDELMTIEHLGELSNKIETDKLCKNGRLTYVYIIESSDDVKTAARTFEEISNLIKPYMSEEIDHDQKGDHRMLWKMLVKPRFGITLDPNDYKKTVIFDEINIDIGNDDIENIVHDEYLKLVNSETVLQTPCTP